MNISEHLSELEALRKERGMSQQELAETCGVSKATICRALNGATEPTARLVQSIEAAVQYTPEEHPVLPAPGQSMEEYVEYLQATIIRQSDDYRRHTMQLQTHYSLLNRQNRRVILNYGHFHCGAGNLPSRLAHLRYHAPGNRMDSEVR